MLKSKVELITIPNNTIYGKINVVKYDIWIAIDMLNGADTGTHWKTFDSFG